MFNQFKNRIICFLLKHTYLDAKVCYAVTKRISKNEMMHYYEMAEKNF